MGSHKIWRAQAKKMRRKRIRQKLAQERDEILLKEKERNENSPRYQAWLSEQRALELFAEEEESRLSAERHSAWLAEEQRAQKVWKERQERLAIARAERAKQELRIKEEWEEEQKKVKAAKEEQERLAEEKKHKQEELMRQIENFINKGEDMPPEVNVASVTNPDRPSCPFFTKTGACRFGDRCSRNHTRPAISRVLLVPNFYDHIGLRQMNPDELEAADDWLEYEDSETYQHFLEFYDDVLPEWERVGRISQFKVCCNFEPHLKGNVYIEYESAQDAVKAFKMFHGRYYGGKQIIVDFVTIESWKAAICGQFHKHCCPKGRSCNFLHVFRNPGNAFRAADHDNQKWRRKLLSTAKSSPKKARGRSWSRSPENTIKRTEWRWSESPSPPMDHSDLSHSDSARSHRSRHDHSNRRSASKRVKGDSSDRGKHCNSERSKDRPRLASDRGHGSDIVKRRRDSEYSEKGASRHRGKRRRYETIDTTIEKHSESNHLLDCEVTQKDNNCDISCITALEEHKGSEESKRDPNKSEIPAQETKVKDRKSKKKTRDSHRKEKKRKKKSLNRSNSSNSSGTDEH